MFVHWHNTEHRHSPLKYVTSEQRHNGEAEHILAQRKRVFEAEKARNPQRWPDEIRDFCLPESVTLAPEKAASF